MIPCEPLWILASSSNSSSQWFMFITHVGITIIDHTLNHHRLDSWYVNHSQMGGLLLSCPHEYSFFCPSWALLNDFSHWVPLPRLLFPRHDLLGRIWKRSGDQRRTREWSLIWSPGWLWMLGHWRCGRLAWARTCIKCAAIDGSARSLLICGGFEPRLQVSVLFYSAIVGYLGRCSCALRVWNEFTIGPPRFFFIYFFQSHWDCL